jgi:hypothetical protein
MKLKDLSTVFVAGVLAIVFVIVNLISEILFAKGGLLILAFGYIFMYLLKLFINVIG